MSVVVLRAARNTGIDLSRAATIAVQFWPAALKTDETRLDAELLRMRREISDKLLSIGADVAVDEVQATTLTSADLSTAACQLRAERPFDAAVAADLDPSYAHRIAVLAWWST